MESITIGQVAVTVTFLVGLIGGIGYLKTHLKEWMGLALKDQFDGLNGKIKALQERIDDVDLNTCKNFLVARLSEIEKDEKLDEIELERFYEQYSHYTEMGGNSYIKNKVDKLRTEGKL